MNDEFKEALLINFKDSIDQNERLKKLDDGIKQDVIDALDETFDLTLEDQENDL